MEKLKLLETQRLVSELSYRQNDYEYKQELMTQVDVQFQNSVLKVLEEYPSISEMYNTKLKETEQNITKIINESKNGDNLANETTTNENANDDEELAEIFETEVEETEDRRTSKVRSLYREIAKITHPDKIKNRKLNDLYIEATNFYNNSDYVELLLIGHKLGIIIDLEDGDTFEIIEKIKFYEDRMKLMESTYTWAWYSEEDDKQKKNILLGYIKSRII